MFKFNINEQVNVIALGYVRMGKVVVRSLTERENSSRIIYEIQYDMGMGCGAGHEIVGEKRLLETQLLELDTHVG
jgi:hypothetical protein